MCGDAQDKADSAAIDSFVALWFSNVFDGCLFPPATENSISRAGISTISPFLPQITGREPGIKHDILSVYEEGHGMHTSPSIV